MKDDSEMKEKECVRQRSRPLGGETDIQLDEGGIALPPRNALSENYIVLYRSKVLSPNGGELVNNPSCQTAAFSLLASQR